MVFGQLVMPVQCCAEARRRHCLGSDDIMSLGIKSSASLRVEHPFARKFDMSSTSGYMGANKIRNLVPDFLTCPQLVGT